MVFDKWTLLCLLIHLRSYFIGNITYVERLFALLPGLINRKRECCTFHINMRKSTNSKYFFLLLFLNYANIYYKNNTKNIYFDTKFFHDSCGKHFKWMGAENAKSQRNSFLLCLLDWVVYFNYIYICLNMLNIETYLLFSC